MPLKLNGTNSEAAPAYAGDDADTGLQCGTDELKLVTGGTARATVDSSGNVGIGKTSSGNKLEIEDQGDTKVVIDARTDAANGSLSSLELWSKNGSGTNNFGQIEYDGDGNFIIGSGGSGGGGVPIVFRHGNTERARIDTSGRLVVNKSGSPSTGEGSEAPVFIQGNTTNANGPAVLGLARGQSASEMSSGFSLGIITFTDDAGNDFAEIKGATDGGSGTDDHPGRITFLTTPDNSSSPTERMRISSSGAVSVGTTNNSPAFNNVVGIAMDGPNGVLSSCRNTNVTASFGRKGNDGSIVEFFQDGSVEGSIVVSGSSVTLSGGHLSRWSQLAGGAERTEILRGSVLSNLDEMCEWAYEAQDAVLYTEEDELPEGVSIGDVKTPAVAAGTEDNEQLNRMKVSDVEGDINVSGVFMAWDDDDETYLNDFYCAMTGDFVIRIAQGTTVARGDLLMSAGDGTAKPQDDDIVRSKTIAKVTSTTVSTTYSDGSYCVPCVLMAC